MATEVRGVVAREKGAPVTVETILVPDPGPGEAVVDVKACGVCHTDLHYREGGINDDFPFLLGHEAAGVVESVGPGVTDLAPGDFVVLNWRAVCGECRSCRRGRPWYCFSTHNATQKMTLADGTPLSPALGIGAFAERTLVAAGQCTKVNPAARPEAVGLLGCGVMAGLGAAMFTGQVGLGDSVAVFGCGGVGCAAVAGSKLAGAATIIAVDLDPRKLELATSFGATHTVDAGATDPVEAIRSLTGGNGADVCIEAVGHPAVMEQAFMARDLAGTLVQVGVPTPDMRIDLPMIEFFGRGRRAEAELVRRLPPLARLPHARRPLPGRPARPRPLRERDHRHRRGRGRLRPHAARRGAAVGRRPLTPVALPLAPFGARTGLRGMVAAADQLAATAGVGMLARGGSAADAAVATGTVMAVVGPHLCGLGGDVLAMVAPPGSPPEALLSVGRAGAGADPARMRAEGMTVDAAAGRRPQRAGAGRRGRLAHPARAPRAAAAGGGPGAGDRAGRGGLRRLDHAGPGEPSRPRAPGSGRAVPRRTARNRPARPRARDRPHAARHRPGRARRVLRRRVRPRPARARERALRPGGPRHQRGAVVRAAATSPSGATTCGPCRRPRRAT